MSGAPDEAASARCPGVHRFGRLRSAGIGGQEGAAATAVTAAFTSGRGARAVAVVVAVVSRNLVRPHRCPAGPRGVPGNSTGPLISGERKHEWQAKGSLAPGLSRQAAVLAREAGRPSGDVVQRNVENTLRAVPAGPEAERAATKPVPPAHTGPGNGRPTATGTVRPTRHAPRAGRPAAPSASGRPVGEAADSVIGMDLIARAR
ncbi:MULTISPECIES: hypothetical protein [unclassified Streptomyces]|uniref:hypothetical protein n=1 Tax=unclassified Streptomyces TaxID=2593676 RepID=UPI0005A67F74|nr:MULTISPECIES: hypothetical protein [unclassified Streptomyces]